MKKSLISWAVPILFAVYCIVMMCLLFARNSQSTPAFNLVPFKTIIEFLYIIKTNDRGLAFFSVINLIGNIVMFIPLGFFPPLIWKIFRNFPASVLLSSVTIIIVELMQYVTARGIADIDDWMLNIAGASTGYLLYRCVSRYMPRSEVSV